MGACGLAIVYSVRFRPQRSETKSVDGKSGTVRKFDGLWRAMIKMNSATLWSFLFS